MGAESSVLFNILAVERVTETLGKIPGASALIGGAIGAALMAGINEMEEGSLEVMDLLDSMVAEKHPQ